MSDLLGSMIGGLFGLGSSLGSNAANYQMQMQANMLNAEQFAKNMAWQREQYHYMQQQNDLTRVREDNALQRRIADAKLAGIHPTIAAGAPAQAGQASSSQMSTPPTHMQPGRIDSNMGQAALQGMMAMAQLDQIKAQTKLVNAQANDVAANAADRHSTVENLHSYRNEEVALQKSSQQLTSDLAAAQRALQQRSLDQHDQSLALQARDTIVKEMLARNDTSNLLRMINETANHTRMTIEQTNYIQTQIRILESYFDRHVIESDRDYTREGQQQTFRRVMDILDFVRKVATPFIN